MTSEIIAASGDKEEVKGGAVKVGESRRTFEQQFVCLLEWWAGNCSITESLAELTFFRELIVNRYLVWF